MSNSGADMPYKVWFAQAWLLYPGVVPSYINRFWAPCTRSGHERTVTKGDLVAPTPDEWSFLIDPTDVGEGLRWIAGADGIAEAQLAGFEEALGIRAVHAAQVGLMDDMNRIADAIYERIDQ